MNERGSLVLTVLAEGALHGHGIVRAVGELTGERVRLRVGALFGVLDRLVASGLVEHDRDEAHQGRPRRYYRLTGAGARVGDFKGGAA